MRELNECKAEVFRRSEERIKEGKRKRDRIFASCATLGICLVVCAILIVPAWLLLEHRSAGSKDTAQAEKDTAQMEPSDENGDLLNQSVIEYRKGSGSISIWLPDDWSSTVIDASEKDFSICIWPEDEQSGKICINYYSTTFGVCGTGLQEEKIMLGDYEAWQGTYDNAECWNFISLIGVQGDYVILNEGASEWWDEYGYETMQILGTIKVAEGTNTEGEVR